MSQTNEVRRHRLQHEWGRFRPALCMVMLVALAAGGCGRDDEVGRAIASSRNTLEALALGGAAPRSLRAAKYQEIVSALTPVAQGADGESVSLAQALLGEALAGQAELAADVYRSADQELLRSVSASSSVLNLYIEQRALEASLTGYVPAPDIAEFDRLSEERRSERAAAHASFAEAQRQRDALLQEAASLAEQARGLRESEAQLRAQAASTDAAARLPLVESAQRTRRQWETLLKQAEELRAQTGLIDPLLVEIELQVKQADRRLASLDQAKQGARERAESLRTQSAEAGRSAQEAAVAVGRAIDATLEAMNDGTKPTFADAAGKYEQSLSRVGSARGAAARAGATVSTGTIAHALGSLRREHGESLARVATLLERAATVQPAIAKAREFSEVAGQLRAEAKQVLQSAAEAYERAASSFESRGAASADDAERLNRLAKALGELKRSITGEPEPQREPTQQEASEMGQSEEGAPAEPQGEPADGVEVPVEESPAEPN